MTSRSRALWGGDQLDLQAYLKRVGYSGTLAPSPSVLRELHLCHTRTIPFENLDILLGRPIELDLAELQRKLVLAQRGGYCFEQNLLFAAVLEHLGFAFTGLGARVTFGSRNLHPVSHMCLCVRTEGQDWLADVGFGADGIVAPVPMSGLPVRQGTGQWEYRVASRAGGTWALESLRAEGWSELYTFASEPRWPVDYEVLNWYTSTYPTSIFASGLIAQLAGGNAKYSLVGEELVVIGPGWQRSPRNLAPSELGQVLKRIFGIKLAPKDLERLLALGTRRSPISGGGAPLAPVPDDEDRGADDGA